MPFVVGLFHLNGEVIENGKITARSITHSADNEVLISNKDLTLWNPKKDELKEKHFGYVAFFSPRPGTGGYGYQMEINQSAASIPSGINVGDNK